MQTQALPGKIWVTSQRWREVLGRTCGHDHPSYRGGRQSEDKRTTESCGARMRIQTGQVTCQSMRKLTAPVYPVPPDPRHARKQNCGTLTRICVCCSLMPPFGCHDASPENPVWSKACPPDTGLSQVPCWAMTPVGPELGPPILSAPRETQHLTLWGRERFSVACSHTGECTSTYYS